MSENQDHPKFENQKQNLGEFIKSQRKMAQMSLRELAERTNISNPYLSQIERGLHEPSIRILRSIAKALNLSLNSLLSQLGLLEDSATTHPDQLPATVETAIYSDPKLTQYQKEVLVASYRNFVGTSDRRTSTKSSPKKTRKH